MKPSHQPATACTERILAVLSLLGVLLAVPAQAQTYPHPISLQGLLLDASGAPLSGNYDLTFRIYDAANGGTALWEETHQNVLVNDGLYNVALGLNPNLPGDLFIGLPRHLEVSVDGDVLNPRPELRAVPLAYSAKTLSDGALQAGSNVSITRRAGGALRIDATGTGGTSGLSSVATDATLTGDGTSGDPLGLDDDAIQAGANVTVTRTNDGAFVVSSSEGGDGLSSVATDATLAGDGTSGAPLSLADGAVTGAKLADEALVAGQNVTITRQSSGALEVAATGGDSGFSLPFSGSTSSSGTAFTVINTGGGDGIEVSSPDGSGLFVGQANDGVYVSQARSNGVAVASASSDGVTVGSAGRHGFWVSSATANGLQIDLASIGLLVGTTNSNGIQITQAGVDGLQVQSAGGDGVRISSANDDGFIVQSAGRNGLAVGTVSQVGVSVFQANSHGVSIGTAGGNGFEVSSAGIDGIQIQSAGRDGVRVGQAPTGVNVQSASGIGMVVGTTGSNGIQVNQAGVDGIQIQSAGRDGIRVSSANALAGNFAGNVAVTGTLSKGGGSFKIDHPLDPANKYLQHSFVESPDMMNVYNGNATLNAAGEAIVALPDYFEALNRDFRYQLTALGAPGPNLYIAEEIQGNRFRIAGGAAGMKVSWQVTGIRQDAWANEHRILVEEDKPADERGFYLHPRLYGQPETRNVIRFDTQDDF